MCKSISWFILGLLLVTFGFSSDIRADTASSDTTLSSISSTLTKAADKSSDPETAVQNAAGTLTDNQKATITNILEDAASNATNKSSETGDSIDIQSVGNGFSVITQTSDVEEGQEPVNPMVRTMPSYYNVTKKYGKRAYIITAGLNLNGIGIATEKLTMHYTLSSKGITMRYSSTNGTINHSGGITSSCKTTDFVATHVGANVNAYAKFTTTFNLTGGTSVDVVHGAVKITSWNKSAKSMKLHENWYYG